MVSLSTLLLTLALSNPGDTVLLEFTAPWCGPCKAMEPTIQRLKSQGYPVRQINIDQNPQLAARYQARSIPCLVMVSGGKEVDRVVGATSYDRLLRMFQKAAYNPQASATKARSTAIQPASRNTSNVPPLTLAGSPTGSRPAAQPVSASALSPHQRAFQATVRLKVDDPKGFSYGTGTIIDLHGEEALVVTCAHIFRDSQGKGKISVDLFPSDGQRTVSGQLISYDMKKDIALVGIRPGVSIASVRVASGKRPVRQGDAVFTIGCDRGADPTMKRSRITGVNKYLGPANFEVAGQPVDGRSGGGLFSQTGELIGVCNAADPADNEGIYAALPVVHWQLDQIGLQRAYQEHTAVAQTNEPPPTNNRPGNGTVAQLETPPLRPVAAKGDGQQTSRGIQDLIRMVNQNPGAEEVICIIRDRQGRGQDRVVVLDPREIQQLRQMTPPGNAANVTNREIRSMPTRMPPARDSKGRIIRAQSEH